MDGSPYFFSFSLDFCTTITYKEITDEIGTTASEDAARERRDERATRGGQLVEAHGGPGVAEREQRAGRAWREGQRRRGDGERPRRDRDGRRAAAARGR